VLIGAWNLLPTPLTVHDIPRWLVQTK